MNNSGQGFRMYRPTKSSIGGQTTSTQEKSNITSKDLHPVRQARGLGDGWPGPLGSDRGNGMSGGSKQWTRAPLHTMEALIVSTPAMSGEGNINLICYLWSVVHCYYRFLNRQHQFADRQESRQWPCPALSTSLWAALLA